MFLLLIQSRDISIPLKLNLKNVLVTLNLKTTERGKDNQLACQLWISEWGLDLDPRVREGVNLEVFLLPMRTCEKL